MQGVGGIVLQVFSLYFYSIYFSFHHIPFVMVDPYLPMVMVGMMTEWQIFVKTITGVLFIKAGYL